MSSALQENPEKANSVLFFAFFDNVDEDNLSDNTLIFRSFIKTNI